MIVCACDFLIDVLAHRRAGNGAAGEVAQISLQPGGSAANVAAWLAHLGVPCGFAGAVGRDLAGDLLMEDLRRRGVTLAVSRHADAATGILLLETLPDGTRRAAAQRGANDLLVLDEQQQHLVGNATWLHLSAYALYAEAGRASLLRAIAVAHARATPVSLDLGAPHVAQHIGHDRYRALLRAAAPDVVLANEEEAVLLAEWTGSAEAGQTQQLDQWQGARAEERQTIDHPLVPDVRAMHAAWTALESMAPIAVIKRGALGCEVHTRDLHFSVPAAPVAAVADTTGAGDAFVAGFIAALHAGRSLRDAAQAGVSLGTQCVTIAGGRPPLERGCHG